MGIIAALSLQPYSFAGISWASLPASLLTLASMEVTRLGGRTGAARVAFLVAFFCELQPTFWSWTETRLASFMADITSATKAGWGLWVIYPSFMVTPSNIVIVEQIPCLDLPKDFTSIDRSTPLANRVWVIIAGATPSEQKSLIDTLLAATGDHHEEIILTSLMETRGHGAEVKVIILSRKKRT